MPEKYRKFQKAQIESTTIFLFFESGLVLNLEKYNVNLNYCELNNHKWDLENLIGPLPTCNIHLWKAGYVIVSIVNWVSTSIDSLQQSAKIAYILGTESVHGSHVEKKIYKKCIGT